MKLELPSLIILAGSSRSGKTYTTKSLILDHVKGKDHLNFGLVFTTTKFRCDYTLIPDRYVLEGFDINIIDKYLNTVKEHYGSVIEKNQKKGREAHIGVPASFIVFDDIIPLINQQDKKWKNFISTFRHYNISLFFSVQYIHMVSPLVRQQADYAFIFFHEQDKSIQALFETFGGLFEKKKHFKNFLHENTTERYACLVFIKDAYYLEEKYKKYKAPFPLKKIKLKF